jgi:hypothetical protein
MPYDIRETLIAMFRELAVSDSPEISGPAWYIDKLRQNQRVAPEGLYSVHVAELYRGVFFRRGRDLVFIAFGFRFPEFYSKLERLRSELARDRVEHP